MTIREATAANITMTRKQAGLTLGRMAASLGVAYQTYAQWETGDRHPTVETLVRICRALGTDPAEFLGEIVDMADTPQTYIVVETYNGEDEDVTYFDRLYTANAYAASVDRKPEDRVDVWRIDSPEASDRDDGEGFYHSR